MVGIKSSYVSIPNDVGSFNSCLFPMPSIPWVKNPNELLTFNFCSVLPSILSSLSHHLASSVLSSFSSPSSSLSLSLSLIPPLLINPIPQYHSTKQPSINATYPPCRLLHPLRVRVLILIPHHEVGMPTSHSPLPFPFFGQERKREKEREGGRGREGREGRGGERERGSERQTDLHIGFSQRWIHIDSW